jgi:hypothetical protein
VSRRVDLLALAASVLTLAVTGLYLAVLHSQQGSPAWWALTVLVVGFVGTAYAVRPARAHRRTALVLSAVGLLGLGLLALLSIGLPLLVAGALSVAAAARAQVPDA